ncbi:hypothetical protein D3C86_1764530 [compost metagenome]
MSSAPAGRALPNATPASNVASVSPTSNRLKCGNAALAACNSLRPVGAPSQWLTSAPISTTHTTRTYCMVATTRESAPKSSDIETITEAAPGATPQAAVLAGIPPKRTMARPTSALRHTVSIVAKSIIGQDWASEVSTARVMECAARIPTAP